MKSLFRKAILLLIIGCLVIGGTYLGYRWIQKRQFEQEVLSAIQTKDSVERLRLEAALRDTRPKETLNVLLATLDSSDPKLRNQAALGLLLYHEHLTDHTRVIIKHLLTDSERGVRLSCAIVLMWVKTPEVEQAYIQALQDKDEKVVQIALPELGYCKNAAANSAVFTMLSHSSWRVRLEACKALITSGAADDRVVSTLEAMQKEEEAKVYDAESAEFDRMEKEAARPGDPPIGHWGNLEEILNRARSIASKHP